MQPYQQRVVEEKASLDEKLAKLRAFFKDVGSAFDKLDSAEQGRLIRQSHIMQDYSDVLAERIAFFKEN